MFFKIVFLLLKLSHVAELIRQEMKDAIRNGNWITNLLFSFGGGAKRPYLQTRHENASIIGRIKNSNITFQSWEGYCWTNSHEKSWAGKMLFCVSLRPQNWLMPCFHFVFNHYVFKFVFCSTIVLPGKIPAFGAPFIIFTALANTLISLPLGLWKT